MKSIRLALMNKKFDDQYTFELHGYLTLHDFESTLSTINRSVTYNPPPGNKLVWIGILWTVWIFIAMAVYTLWASLDLVSILITIPILMFLATIIFLWRHRHIRCKFEQSVLDTCGTINATENIRGINYRFSKNGMDITTTGATSTKSNNNTSNVLAFYSKPRYSIVIEFDDRYNALSGQRFSSPRYHNDDFISIPLYAGAGGTERDDLDEPKHVHYSEKDGLRKETVTDLPHGTLNYYNENDPHALRYN
ncbi:hypothetical protein BDA99DRAFT_565365 [Phascolomyces articulosus]|uniref:Uncharacterized protein n=1 Tax=Phascolomyces articulosus TaxID=60185 RepID=A0AAD5P8D5_9FUNG|nr:hypothetical protein BDA99DRAFT_565365 [Phascolomyces articulosus]